MYPIARPSKLCPARPLALTARTLAVIVAASLLNPAAGNAAEATDWPATAYRGSVNVVEGPDEDQRVIDGIAFVDEDQDSVQDGNTEALDVIVERVTAAAADTRRERARARHDAKAAPR